MSSRSRSRRMTRVDARPTEPRLLVVEDDPNIVELLSASLRFAGFEVEPDPIAAIGIDSKRAASVQPRASAGSDS